MAMSKKERINHIKNLCNNRGIKIVDYGGLWHLKGGGIDILTRDLSLVQPYELDPNTGRSQYARH